MHILTSLFAFTGIASAQRILDHIAYSGTHERVDTSKLDSTTCVFSSPPRPESKTVRTPSLKRVISGRL